MKLYIIIKELRNKKYQHSLFEDQSSFNYIHICKIENQNDFTFSSCYVFLEYSYVIFIF